MRFILLSLLLAALPAVAKPPPPSRVVWFTSADGVRLVATYYPVAAALAPAVILVPGFSQDRQSWSQFAVRCQTNGLAALALDLRGHGDSTRQSGPLGLLTLNYRDLTPQDFQSMALDVEAAFTWLTEQPEINDQRIAVAGASVGANVALRYAALNDEVAALLLLSPGLTYKGLRTDDVIQKYGPRPLRIAVGVGDAFAYESSKRLIEIRQETFPATKAERELLECQGGLHGTILFAGISKLAPALVTWLKQVLFGTP